MKRFVATALRVTLGLLFVYAATAKLGNMHQFAEEIANYRMLPPAAVPGFAVLLVGLELCAGTLLLVGVAARAAATVIATLLVAFIAALSQALLRGVDLRCGCFGGSDLATWGTVARDVAMLAAAALVFAWPPAGDDRRAVDGTP
jgi:putative oxidoreductase